jgi:4-alpha-glucanotransferase
MTVESSGDPERYSGILTHPTSFPGPYGIGDLGDDALTFIDFLAAAGQRLWQIMPLGPTGFGDSPYASFSAFAGNPLLISLKRLSEQGLLSPEDISNPPLFPEDHVDYGPVIAYHQELLKKSYAVFQKTQDRSIREEFNTFIDAQGWWLDDYALFMAYKDLHDGMIWNQWSAGKGNLYFTPPDDTDDRVLYHKYLQFQFFAQWRAVKEYANGKGIRIIGDVPIFVAYDSADVWAHPGLFKLDKKGNMTVVSGVPPDLFSETGQRWGNPVYRWNTCKKQEFSWWIDRFRWMLEMVDLVRIDHFRGFAACWEIPADHPTAEKGKWVRSKGKELFTAVGKALGSVPVLAEDLGVITPDVDKLRDMFGLPGMKILQFGFGGGPDSPYLPHNYTENSIVYTGSHDNDTTRGWYDTEQEKTRDHVRRYLGVSGDDIAWDMIRSVLASVSRYAVIPLQDILSLNSEARMNFPGKAEGNWQWRYTPDMLDTFTASRLKGLTELYGRG